MIILIDFEDFKNVFASSKISKKHRKKYERVLKFQFDWNFLFGEKRRFEKKLEEIGRNWKKKEQLRRN